jgi:hypothetical protein
MDTGMQPSGDECVPVQRSHVHENESHEDMHRGTEAPADELTRQKGASPLQQINMCFFMFYRWIWGPPVYPRTGELSRIG